MQNLNIKVKILSGYKSLKNLNKSIVKLKFKHEFLICDSNLSKNIYIKKQTKKIKNKLFINFKSEPTYQMLNEYIKKIKKIKIDCIIAIGGANLLPNINPDTTPLNLKLYLAKAYAPNVPKSIDITVEVNEIIIVFL